MVIALQAIIRFHRAKDGFHNRTHSLFNNDWSVMIRTELIHVLPKESLELFQEFTFNVSSTLLHLCKASKKRDAGKCFLCSVLRLKFGRRKRPYKRVESIVIKLVVLSPCLTMCTLCCG
jgi:hypothetical protein